MKTAREKARYNRWHRDALVVRAILSGAAFVVIVVLFIVFKLAIEASPSTVNPNAVQLDFFTSAIMLMLMFPGFTVMCLLPSLGIVAWFGWTLLTKEAKSAIDDSFPAP